MSLRLCIGSPGRDRRRRQWALSLRTLMLAILIVGAALGWGNYRRRCSAVDGLLTVVRSGILLEVGPSQHRKDPTHEPDRGRYQTELRRVRSLHAEPLAVSHLVEALRVARLRRDEKSMRGALVALMWLGTDSRAGVPEIVRTVRGKEFGSVGDQGATQIRNLAIHVLGVHATEDDLARATLVATVEAPDYSFQRTVSSSAANQLGGLGPKAEGAVPALIKALELCNRPGPSDLLRGSAISALGRLGPVAIAAIPKLAGIANDPRDGDRLDALKALGEIGVSIDFRRKPGGLGGGTGADPAPSRAELVELFEALLEDSDSAIREEARWQLRRLGTLARPRFETAR